MQNGKLYVRKIYTKNTNHDFQIDPKIPLLLLLLFCNHITNYECWQCGLFAGFLVQWTVETNDHQSTEHPQPLPRWVTGLRLICLQLIIANVNLLDFHVLPNNSSSVFRKLICYTRWIAELFLKNQSEGLRKLM